MALTSLSGASGARAPWVSRPWTGPIPTRSARRASRARRTRMSTIAKGACAHPLREGGLKMSDRPTKTPAPIC